MKLFAFFAVPLLLTLVGEPSRKAPDAPTTPPTQSATGEDSSAAPKTPREIAEMRAEIMMARKDYSEAAVAYQRLLEQDPGNADILNKIGIAYQQLGQDSVAEHYYKKALRADKKSTHALNNLGTIEYSRQRFGKAIKYYKKAVAAGGDDLAPIYSNLGYAYCGIKQYPQAMEAFGKALALDPNVFEPKGMGGTIVQHRTAVDQGALYFMVAKSYAKTGDVERTARYLKLARDDGYKDFLAAEKDPDFARVIKDPQVQNVLHRRPAYEAQQDRPVTN
jgi:tetratricopeptide (TPR) repeat protein